MHPRGPALAGLAFALSAGVLFGLVNVAAKDSLLHPLHKAGIAYALAGVAFLPALWKARIRRRDWGRVALMTIVGGVAAPVLLFYGLERTTAVNASLLLTLEMVFTAVLAISMLRERLVRGEVLGLALLLCAGGLVAAAAPGATNGHASSIAGSLLVAAAALGWGIDNTVSTALTRRYHPHHLIAIKTLAGGGLMLAAVSLLGLSHDVPGREIPRVAFIGLFGIGASTLLMYNGFRRIGATLSAGVFIPVAAVAGAAGGWALLHEPVGWPHGAALILIVIGVLLVARRSPQPPRAP